MNTDIDTDMDMDMAINMDTDMDSDTVDLGLKTINRYRALTGELILKHLGKFEINWFVTEVVPPAL